MSEQYSCAYDVGTLLHNLLFSYQKATKDVLGKTGEEVFYHPTIDLLLKIEENSQLKIISADTLDEALSNYSNFLSKTGVMKSFEVNKNKDGQYRVAVKGCTWANHLHQILQPKDIMCPWAMIAMAIVQKYKGERMEETYSIIDPDGSQTTIKPLRFGFSREEAYRMANSPSV